MICNTNEDNSLEKQHPDALISQRVSGILCLTGNHCVINGSIPVVYLDRRPQGYKDNEDCLVESDNMTGGRLAALSLLEAGCKNIAVLYAKDVDINHQMRFESAVSVLKEHGMKADVISIDRVSTPLATAAVKQLVQMVGGEQVPHNHVVLPVRLIERETTRG